MSTGTRLPSRRNSRHTSRPSMSGSPTSRTTASGTDVVTSDSASDPEAASTTSYPDSDSARRRTSRRARSSSTTSNLIAVIVARKPPGREQLLRSAYPRLRRLLSAPRGFLSALRESSRVLGGGALAQDGPQDAVDEGRRARPTEALGGLDGFVDRPLGRDRLGAGHDVGVEDLHQGPRQDGALQRGDPAHA